MAPLNSIRRLPLLVLLLVVPGAASQAEPVVVTAKPTVSASRVPEKNQESLKPRIKYRNGPVCMCNGGMSEAEIQAGMKKRNLSSKTSGD